ncbi:M23 family metallopeptidase [Kribbella sp. NBC_01245]|uniref:M23 family metallopeptidase n=1 Tax=Kribbella sp. NBC_01245 TaxID=2903578 RepID=UPI002E2AECEE|nr:M23 family metallopeptidase [Kribbella sp. NBC_01245]
MDTFFRPLSRCCLFLVAVFAAQAAATAPAWAAALAPPAASAPAGALSTADASAPAGALATADDGWPLSPRPAVVRPFEPPPEPWAAGHRGVDLAGAIGQAVLAPAPGTVRFAGAIAGRGVVVLTHGSSRTTYEPVVAVVRVGQVLARGEPLGRLSAAGSHCAPATCLHWGLLRGKQYVDPLTLIRHQGVRLLPLLPPDGKPGLPPDGKPGLPPDGMPGPAPDGKPGLPLDGKHVLPLDGRPVSPLDLDGKPVAPLDGEPLSPVDGVPVARSGPVPSASGDGGSTGSGAAGGSGTVGSGGRGDGSAGALAVGLAATAVIGSAVLVRRH